MPRIESKIQKNSARDRLINSCYLLSVILGIYIAMFSRTRGSIGNSEMGEPYLEGFKVRVEHKTRFRVSSPERDEGSGSTHTWTFLRGVRSQSEFP
jgi:hypothetical protein